MLNRASFFFRVRTAILIFLLSPAIGVRGQDVAAFHNYLNRFVVFDQGKFVELEQLPVLDFKVRANMVVYLTNDNRLKVYQNGKKEQLTEFFEYYKVGEDFVVWEFRRQVYMFSKGQTQLICDWCNADGSDSLMRLIKNPGSKMEIYYSGKFYPLTEGVETTGILSYKFDKNIFSYVDAGQNLRIFYRGELFDPGVIQPGKYQVGADIVAWIDPFENSLKAFFKNEVVVLDNQVPKNFRTADGMVAWVDNGKVRELATFEPEKWTLKDEILAFELNRLFFVFYKGEVKMLEEIPPKAFSIERNTLFYIDAYGRLAGFSAGEHKKNLSLEPIFDLQSQRGVVLYKTGNNTQHVFWKGKSYVY
jgi:hypothetical protein